MAGEGDYTEKCTLIPIRKTEMLLNNISEYFYLIFCLGFSIYFTPDILRELLNQCARQTPFKQLRMVTALSSLECQKAMKDVA